MGINISITGGHDKSTSSVHASGKLQHVITDDERMSFYVWDEPLKKAVRAYWGNIPIDAYLHSPTPWDDLYKTHNWQQVKVLLAVKSAEILEITSEPTIVKQQAFTNDGPEKATFNVSISETVENTVSTNWNIGNKLSFSDKSDLSIKIMGLGGDSEFTVGYEHSWGTGGEESKSITLGTTAGVEVPLDPGESVDVELAASRGVMKVQIRYIAKLFGKTVVHYDPPYRGHHFWSLPIGRVMSAGGISNSSQTVEDIEVGYYSDSTIVVRNNKTKAVKATFPIADTPQFA